MGQSKYEEIYHNIKQKIEDHEYEKGSFLPSENTLITVYDCSRNTVRRAISKLIDDGYVQSSQGKGVSVIFTPTVHTSFKIGGIETFKESAERNKVKTRTKVLTFEEITIDRKTCTRTGLKEGEEAYHVLRLRFINNKPLILDENYFLKKIVSGLTAEKAALSVYDYIEGELNVQILTSKRIMTVEHASEADEKYIKLGDYNCMAVITSRAFTTGGLQFEYTVSRHHPDYFMFEDTAVRNR